MKKKISVISAEGRRDANVVAALRLLSAVASGYVLVSVAGNVIDHPRSGIGQWAGTLVAGVLAAAAAYAEISFGGHSARAEERRIRRELLGRLFAARGAGRPQDPAKLVQMLTDNTERITEFRQIFVGSTVAAMLIPFVVLAYVGVAYDPILGFGIMAMCPLIPLLLGLFMRFFRKTSANSRRERSRLAGRYLDAIRNLVTIRLLGAGPRIEAQLREQGERNRGAIMKLLAGNQLVIIVVDGLFSLILICSTAALAIARFHAGALTLSQALATVLLTALLIEPLVQVAGFFYIGMGGIASQKAIRSYYGENPISWNDDADVVLSAPASSGAIELRGVSFDYGRGPVLRGVDLNVPQGARVAIVGRSGEGKTTLLNLIRANLSVQSGRVVVGGQDLATIEPREARALTAAVSQSTWLFTGTIADNLRIAKEDATESEMWSALRQAQVAEEVERMPEGLHTDVGEQGGFISGGQAQRISIARALLSGRKILILDEPTSQVDIESENKIISAIAGLGRSWTVLLVTHRRALLALADAVYEMKDGRLVASVGSERAEMWQEDASQPENAPRTETATQPEKEEAR